MTVLPLIIAYISRHRNGIGGHPFHAVLFRDTESLKLGVVFDQPHYVAVFDMEQLAQGDVVFGSNSFRGDVFEPHLRAAIAQFEAESANSNPGEDPCS